VVKIWGLGKECPLKRSLTVKAVIELLIKVLQTNSVKAKGILILRYPPCLVCTVGRRIYAACPLRYQSLIGFGVFHDTFDPEQSRKSVHIKNKHAESFM
jgi:hypothetical protein